MTSELPDDPKRPRKDDDEAVDEDAEDEDEDEDERLQRDRDERAFKEDLENADEFEPTLDVPLPLADRRSKRAGR